MKKYELVVFDWDGTLMDSEAKIVRCFEGACRDAGIPYPGPEACRNVIGLGMQEAIDMLFPACESQQQQLLIERYREHFLVLDQTDMPFFPGVQQGLQRLEKQGYLMAVATGKARRGLDRVLNQWDMQQQFVATRCADEAFSKPHPQMLHDILDATGLDVEQAIMVGDSVYDMEMAHNANMHSLAVSYGVHACDRLLDFKPQVCAHSFEEVCEWLL